MKNLVSIITPFHNTDLDSFKMSFDSVIGQTMKPSKYEYIIVLHNCVNISPIWYHVVSVFDITMLID